MGQFRIEEIIFILYVYKHRLRTKVIKDCSFMLLRLCLELFVFVLFFNLSLFLFFAITMRDSLGEFVRQTKRE